MSHAQWKLLKAIHKNKGLSFTQALDLVPAKIIANLRKKDYIVLLNGLYQIGPRYTLSRPSRIEKLLPTGDCICPKHNGEYKTDQDKIVVLLNIRCPTHSFILTGRKFRNNNTYHFVRVNEKPQSPLLEQVYTLHRIYGSGRPIRYAIRGKPSFEYIYDFVEKLGYRLVLEKKNEP